MTNNLILASSCQEKLAYWKQGMNGFACTTLAIDSLSKLRGDVGEVKPSVLLLDFDLLGLNGMASLRSICTETKTIIIGGAVSENMEWILLKAGVRGCCQSNVDPTLLRQVVETVLQNELWIRRTLICRLIDELGKTAAISISHRASLGLLDRLTQREYAIALRVVIGETNKQIASSCAIAERTVKAHLTEIYLKLGVTDRLNLALVMSAVNKKHGYSHQTPEIHHIHVARKSGEPDMLEPARIIAY
jgi:DNA-binding NarL/FixJ family response regulator